jgi:hypothetical protein
MSSTNRSEERHARSARDRGLATLRRARRVTVVTGVAAAFGFTVLAARAFPGHAKARQDVASLTPRHLAPAPPRRHHRAHRHHHPSVAAAAASPVQPPPAPSAAPPPVAAPPVQAPPPQPVAPAPVPQPTPQPPVVSSGGS